MIPAAPAEIFASPALNIAGVYATPAMFSAGDVVKIAGVFVGFW
jgi:hypothetical protein